MNESPSENHVAVIDHGLGNIFSVKLACEKVGLSAFLTSDPKEVGTASAVILPGVGAFGDAMDALRREGLVDAIVDYANRGRPLVGICLGLQLFMSESFEFGRHSGFDFFSGSVKRLEPAESNGRQLKVPRIGWAPVFDLSRSRPEGRLVADLFDGVKDGTHMYYVHSFVANPSNDSLMAAKSSHAETEICAAIGFENIAAFQFHPERSGQQGLKIYRNLRRIVDGKGS